MAEETAAAIKREDEGRGLVSPSPDQPGETNQITRHMQKRMQLAVDWRFCELTEKEKWDQKEILLGGKGQSMSNSVDSYPKHVCSREKETYEENGGNKARGLFLLSLF